MRKLDKKELREKAINNAKEIIAKKNGFSDKILGSSWNYAMQITHRTRKQIEMYEAVLSFMADCIIDLKK